MWCRNCDIELKDSQCPVCGESTTEDIPTDIYWCDECRVPVISLTSQADKGICPRCGGKTHYMATDVRPVFPEECLLLEILLGKEPLSYLEKSVWATNSRYYIDGESISLSSALFQKADATAISNKISAYAKDNNYLFFDQFIQAFVEANTSRLNFIKDEAYQFITKEASKFSKENIVVSFSGGKDSTQRDRKSVV